MGDGAFATLSSPVSVPCLFFFSKNLRCVVLGPDLSGAEDALDDAVFVEDEGSAVSAHIGASVHFLLAIHAEGLHQFQVCVGNERKRQSVLLDEFPV